jgi:dolichol-phosphate mannosyltransferase
LLDRRVVDALLLFPETNGFLRGLTALVGFKQIAVSFDRPARHSGKGNYNRFFGSLRIGLNGLVCFSSALLNLSTWFGLLAAVGSILVALGYLVAKLGGVDFPVGNPTIVILVLLIGGLQLICLGIMGQYIGRIYDEVKRRPRYLVDRAAGLPSADAHRLWTRAARPLVSPNRANHR